MKTANFSAHWRCGRKDQLDAVLARMLPAARRDIATFRLNFNRNAT